MRWTVDGSVPGLAGRLSRIVVVDCSLKGDPMRLNNIALAALFAISCLRSGSPSKPYMPSYDTSGKGKGPSGSGSSTSGGRDDSGDEGRDKMPEANAKVRPTPRKPDIPNAANQK